MKTVCTMSQSDNSNSSDNDASLDDNATASDSDSSSSLGGPSGDDRDSSRDDVSTNGRGRGSGRGRGRGRGRGSGRAGVRRGRRGRAVTGSSSTNLYVWTTVGEGTYNQRPSCTHTVEVKLAPPRITSKLIYIARTHKHMQGTYKFLLILPGKCKIWTVDLWTGQWTGLWTGLWTRFSGPKRKILYLRLRNINTGS